MEPTLTPTDVDLSPDVRRKQTITDLLDAAGVIRTRGRAAHGYADVAGRVCMLGALGVAVANDPYFTVQMDGVSPEWQSAKCTRYEYAKDALHEVIGFIPDYSDYVCKTAEQAALAFERVADQLAAEQSH